MKSGNFTRTPLCGRCQGEGVSQLAVVLATSGRMGRPQDGFKDEAYVTCSWVSQVHSTPARPVQSVLLASKTTRQEQDISRGATKLLRCSSSCSPPRNPTTLPRPWPAWLNNNNSHNNSHNQSTARHGKAQSTRFLLFSPLPAARKANDSNDDERLLVANNRSKKSHKAENGSNTAR